MFWVVTRQSMISLSGCSQGPPCAASGGPQTCRSGWLSAREYDRLSGAHYGPADDSPLDLWREGDRETRRIPVKPESSARSTVWS